MDVQLSGELLKSSGVEAPNDLSASLIMRHLCDLASRRIFFEEGGTKCHYQPRSGG
jgi:hypothetical protein